MKRKFSDNVVDLSINKVQELFENSFEVLDGLLRNAIDVSEQIYNSIKNNDRNFMDNINFQLKQLDLIDVKTGRNEYIKKFFDLINVIFYKKEADKNNYLKIAYNNLQIYRTKLLALDILNGIF